MDSPNPQVNWYSVKVLFESIHSGEDKLFEESIFIVKATEMEQACKLAKEYAEQAEHQYLNGYGEKVEHRFVSVLHAFELNDAEVMSGVEVYARFIHAKRTDTPQDIIERYYPEAVDKPSE